MKFTFRTVEMGLRVCISKKLSGGADAVSSQAMLWAMKPYMIHLFFYHLPLCLCDLLHFWYYPLFLELHWPLIVLEYPGMYSRRYTSLSLSLSPASSSSLPLSASSLYTSITFLVKTFLAIWCNKVIYLLHVLLSLTYSIFLLNTITTEIQHILFILLIICFLH